MADVTELQAVARWGIGVAELEPRFWPPGWSLYADTSFRYQERSTLLGAATVVYEGALVEDPLLEGVISESSLHFEGDILHLQGSGVRAAWSPNDNTLRVFGVPEEPERSLNNALRLWIASMLPMWGDGLMLHGAACISGGQGMVLAGVSGAGKSTFAQGLTGSLYLSDDIAVVDRLTTTARILPTPFHGALGRLGVDAEAPLDCLAILEHGEHETVIRRLQPSKAVPALLRHVVCFGRDASLAAAILDRVAQLVERVPVFALRRSLSDSSEEVCARLRLAVAGS